MARPPCGVESISRSSANEAQRVRASDSFCDLLLLSLTDFSDAVWCELTSFVHTALDLLLHPLRGLEEDLRATDFTRLEGSCRSRQTSIPRSLPRRISHRKSVSSREESGGGKSSHVSLDTEPAAYAVPGDRDAACLSRYCCAPPVQAPSRSPFDGGLRSRPVHVDQGWSDGRECSHVPSIKGNFLPFV